MRLILQYSIIVCLLLGCKNKTENKNISEEEYSRPKGSYQKNIKGIVSIQTYDHYMRMIKKGYGFYINSKTIIAPFSLVKGSFKVKASPVGLDEYYDILGYTAYDIKKDLVLLKSVRKNLNYLNLDRAIENIPDSIASLYRIGKKLYAPKYSVAKKVITDSITYFQLMGKVKDGLPSFTYMHHIVGITKSKGAAKDSSILIPVKEIVELVKKQIKTPRSIYDLRGKTNKIYPSYTNIKGFKIQTSLGVIELKLYNETPKFRDNFIKLVSDQFYDSLLVHRVLPNFLIQTGASDSKYAKKNDIVGWQGPGYMLKTEVNPSKFHKRGALAMSKLPDSRNPKNLTDGSQFYIVSGRVFNATELNDIEKEKNIKFTKKQRKIYTTVGGAPHLDGDYVVFGEVTKGMNVVDEISATETNSEDRPIKDIRVLKIDIIQK